MVHEQRFRRGIWAAFALEKRHPKTGLLGDVVTGVETVANNAVSGVVGVATTVLSDVDALASPPKSTAAASSSSKKAGAHATTTATLPATSTATAAGSKQTMNGGQGGNSGNSGGSNSSNDSGSSNGSGSSNTSDGSVATSDSDSGSSGSTDSTNGDGSGVVGAPTPTQGNAGSSKNHRPDSQILEPGATPSDSDSSTKGLDKAAGSGNISGSAALPSPIINAVGSESSNFSSGSILSSGTRGPTVLSLTPHSSSTASSGPNSSDNGKNGSDASSSNGHGALPPAAIAGIVVACLLGLLLCGVLTMRKWHRNRRARRFENWVSRPGFMFFGTTGGNANSNEKVEKSVHGVRSGAGSGSGTRSARSSFGTTFDHGLRPFTPDSFFAAPSPASFSETHATVNTPTSFLTAPSVPPTARSGSYNAGGGSEDDNRNTSTEAVAEEAGGSSDGHAQYLLAPPTQGDASPNRPQLSPISVRPWSPSERWAFPKPPMNTAQSAECHKTPSPSGWSTQVERVPASTLPPLSVTPHPEHNPFADPDASAASEDAVAAHTSPDTNEDRLMGSIEYIRRPFVPTLADEMAVHRSDIIRVLQAFDDGWVQVEKLSSASSSCQGERGLIPVDCLREAGEALPSFLASRRVSSHYAGVAL